MVTNALLMVVTLIGAIIGPLVAYPLARVVKNGRQAVDSMLNWKGTYAHLLEEVEDGLTYFASFSVAVLVWILIGTIYTWYVQTVTLSYNPWLGYAILGFPTYGFNELGYYNGAVILYWGVVYLTAFVAGWKKTETGR